MTINVDENKVKELFCIPQSEINASTRNRWKSAIEFVGLFCAIALTLPLLDCFANQSLSTFDIVALAIGSILFVVEIFCIIKSMRFNKKIQKKVCDKSSEYTYSVLNGMFVEKTPHSSSVGDDITYTYNFKIEGKECIFSEIQLLGRQKPTEEFFVLKIVFTFNDGNVANRIYAFNKKEFSIQLPKEKEVANNFSFDNRFGLCTFVS